MGTRHIERGGIPLDAVQLDLEATKSNSNSTAQCFIPFECYRCFCGRRATEESGLHVFYVGDTVRSGMNVVCARRGNA